MRVAVLGPGGVGGFLAAALHRAGTPTVVVAREETAALLRREGLRVESVRLGAFEAQPDAVAVLREPVDVLVVATKATTLVPALARVEAEPGLVVPLLNGLDHLAVLRERFGADRVPAAAIRIESDRPEPGVIVHTSPFLRVDLARPARGSDLAVEQFAHVLRAAETPTEVLASEPDVLWGKLVRLNALACTTAAFAEPLGAIRSHPRHRLALEGCVDEGARVARAEGAAVEPGTVLAELAAAHPELTTSMSRDVAAGREPELDAIPGAVLRAAARHGIGCPTIAGLVERIEGRLRSR